MSPACPTCHLTPARALCRQVFEAARGYSEAGAGVGMHINGLMACEAIHPSIAHT